MLRIRPPSWWLLCCVMVAALPGKVLATGQDPVAFEASATFDRPDCEVSGNDLEDVIEFMIDLGYDVSLRSLETTGVDERKHFRDPDDVDFFFPDFFDDSGNLGIRFGGQDAILVRVCAPSENNYFGFTAYRTDDVLMGAGDAVIRTSRNASLGDSQNMLSISGAVFNQPLNLVVTADQQTADDLLQAFAASNVLEPVEVLPIDAAKFLFSATDEDFPRSEIALTARQSRIKGYAIRAEGDDTRPLFVFSKAEIAPRVPFSVDLRDTYDPTVPAITNFAFRTVFARLVLSVIAKVERDYPVDFVSQTAFRPRNGVAASEEASIFEHGFECIDEGLDCGLDNRDDHYAWDRSAHILTSDRMYVLVAVDFSKLAILNGPMAQYNSVGVYNVGSPGGPNFEAIRVLKNYDYPPLNPDLLPTFLSSWGRRALMDNTFVVQIAGPAGCNAGLDGDDLDSVVELDDSLCLDDTIDPTSPVVFMGQATLNPNTTTGPDPHQLVPWRLLTFEVNP